MTTHDTIGRYDTIGYSEAIVNPCVIVNDPAGHIPDRKTLQMTV